MKACLFSFTFSSINIQYLESTFHSTLIHFTALRIHVSPECKAVLDKLGGFHLEERGPVTLKVSLDFSFFSPQTACCLFGWFY